MALIGAEIAYPASEGISAGLVSAMINVAGLGASCRWLQAAAI
jgi:hypothetical protein